MKQRLVVRKIRLTQTGRNKLKRLADLGARAIEATLEEMIPVIKDRVAEFAPDEKTEAALISAPGSDYDFFKEEAGFISLREAIVNEYVPILKRQNKILAQFGDPDKINPLIGFGWYAGSAQKGNRELRRTSDPEAGPAWQHLLEMWENGSYPPFIVTARDGGLMVIDISGNKYTVVESVLKSIPSIQPFTMYAAGSHYSRTTLLRRLQRALKEITSWL